MEDFRKIIDPLQHGIENGYNQFNQNTLGVESCPEWKTYVQRILSN